MREEEGDGGLLVSSGARVGSQRKGDCKGRERGVGHGVHKQGD